jgi:hypothetical protein
MLGLTLPSIAIAPFFFYGKDFTSLLFKLYPDGQSRSNGMRQSYHVVIAVFAGLSFIAATQTANASDPPYVIFGEQSVTLGPVTKTGGASVGSNGNLTFGGSDQVGGAEGGGNFVGGTTVVADHITMNGFVSLGGGTHVTHDVNAGGYISTGTTVVIGSGGAGNAVAGGNITLVGGNVVHGNVDSGGNVWLNTNTAHIDGNVTAAGTFTNGTSFVGGTITAPGVPTLPLAYTPIILPPATVFGSGGAPVTNPGPGGITLGPGSYGALDITGAQTSLTLTAGSYYFDTFNYQSTFPALTFDVSAGKIFVYVTGNVDFRQSATISVDGGTAADVVLETHGDFTTGGDTTWNGTVFAPDGTIYIAKNNVATGAFWGQVVTTENDVTFSFNPGEIVPEPESSTLALVGLALLAVVYNRRKRFSRVRA